MKQETLDRFDQARRRSDEAVRQLRDAIANLINSSDLNDRLHEVRPVGALESLRDARDEEWAEYLAAERELLTELSQGLFPGQHSVG